MNDEIDVYQFLKMLFMKNAENMGKAHRSGLGEMAEICGETALLIIALEEHMRKIDKHIEDVIGERDAPTKMQIN